MNKENVQDIQQTDPLDTILNELPVNWKWLLALGIFMLIAGTLGIVMSVVLTLASVLFFGILVGTAGVLQLIQGVQSKEKKWIGKAQHFLIALLYIVTAGLIFWDPVAASQGMTLVLAALFTAIGITRIYHAIRCQRQQWKWVLPVLLGLVDLVLAAIIILGWPATGLWIIGLFIAIELIMNGWFITLLALRVKKAKTVG